MVGLTIVLRPFVEPLILILKRINLSIKILKIISAIILILTLLSFIILVEYPYSEKLKICCIVLLLLNSYWYEVQRGLTEVEGYSDILILTALLYYLWNEILIGRYINPIYLPLSWALSVVGITFSKKFGDYVIFDYKSERDFFLFIFSIAGYTHKSFGEYLCYGFMSLTFLIYLSLLYKFMRSKGINLKKIGSYIPRPKIPDIRKREETSEYIEIPKYRYTVVVTDENGAPVSNAKVAIVGSNQYVTKLTNINGKCEFSLFEGEYKINIRAKGFLEINEERFISADSGEIFKLSRPYRLNLLVIDENSNLPIPNATVTLNLKDESHRSGTDNIGVAFFSNLKGEKYKIRVDARGYEIWEGEINPKETNSISIRLRKFPEKISNIIQHPCLIEYSTGLENIILKICRAYLEEGKKVILASSPPSTAFYERNLSNVRLINLPSKGELSEDLTTIPLSNIDQFDYIIDSLDENSILIFEPFSKLMLTKGPEDSFKFLEKLLKKSGDKLLMCLNLGSVEEKERKKIESKFKDIFVVDKGKLNRRK